MIFGTHRLAVRAPAPVPRAPVPVSGACFAGARCRTVDRIDPARVLGPRYRFGRGTSASDSEILCRLLQLRQNASVFAQGCADFSSDSSDRDHSFTPDPRRPSPSLRPGFSFRYTQVVAGNHPADLALPNGPTAGRLFNSRHYFSMD